MPTRSPGFTLIELIVSVAILAIIVSVGIAGFISFQDDQQVLSATKELQQLFVNAQVKARVKETPSTCGTGTLNGYKITRTNEVFTLTADCATPVVRDSVSLTGYTVSGGLASGGSILFKTQFDSTITPTKICIQKGTVYYGFSISGQGQVSDVERGDATCP